MYGKLISSGEVVSDLSGFDFFTLVDDCAAKLADEAGPEDLLREILTRSKASVRDWLFVVPIENLKMRPKSRPVRLGRFEVVPEMLPSKTRRQADRFATLLRSRGVNNSDEHSSFAKPSMFEHIDKRWAGALSRLPLLLFRARGSAQAWLQAEAAVTALRSALLANEPVYQRPAPVYQTNWSAFLSDAPEAANYLQIDCRTGWFARHRLSRGVSLPPLALAARGSTKAHLVALLRLLDVSSTEPKDGLHARVARMAKMMVHADMAPEEFVQLLFTVVGLECLVSVGKGGEIGTRLADTVGQLVAHDSSEYLKLRKLVRTLYELRSSIVHNGDTPHFAEDTDEPPSAWEDSSPRRQARWLLRECIRAAAAARESLLSIPPDQREQAFWDALGRARFDGRRALPWRKRRHLSDSNRGSGVGTRPVTKS